MPAYRCYEHSIETKCCERCPHERDSTHEGKSADRLGGSFSSSSDSEVHRLA